MKETLYALALVLEGIGLSLMIVEKGDHYDRAYKVYRWG